MDREDTFSRAFSGFVCAALAALLGLHLYAYCRGHAAELADGDGDLGDVKQVVLQLSHGLSEVNRKHERLQVQMAALATALPARAGEGAGAGRDSLEPAKSKDATLYEMDYDRQMTDYALESAGARVLDTGATAELPAAEGALAWPLRALAAALCRACGGAGAMLRPGALPGECWRFRGARGEALVRLVGMIQVTGVALEHIPPSIAPTKEISSAPRLVNVQGIESRTDPYPHDFGTFEYDREGKPIQYFDVKYPSPKGYYMLRIRFLSNWGHPVYTCVYRVRVHGNLVPGQTPRITVKHEELDSTVVEVE